jgi:perosamine synthetase
MEELVQTRLDSARALAEAAKGCAWLIPQSTPSGYVHSYWTYVVRLADGVPFTWQEFRKKYIEFGGDGFYGAWAANYLEPVFRGKRFGDTQTQVFEQGLCPITERLQPRLMQFKTNYFDSDNRRRAADALSKAIAFFSRRG